MKTISELIEALRGIDLGESGNVGAFERGLAEVVALRTTDSIVPLMGLFRDDAPYDELMFSIIHGIEVFEDAAYVAEVLRDVSSFCSGSPRWASIVFMRMLNTESTRLELVRQLRDADAGTKAAVKSLMEKINARSFEFLPKTTAVIAAAS
ncbi:hypothetical protein JIN84_08790 [Luteolibacter yonseiensis]|uniref:Immunity protein 30 domain-containing protein n=1 Tax=Luteolibacter yonseiensis TaxID=1144680 RepID=A0A934R2C4_9BACT|nr:Imm30 family immunity protein [Luteolibacter yonseiensis]MBK1815711.1 hypothetical protein [Luteolibacter yonseiensis]